MLNCIVHPNQSAFIPGRRIADNIMLAHELVRGYHSDKGCCCAIKVDFQKAYYSISWDFLEEVLIAFRFPQLFILLVMNAVKSSMFSIMINGQLEGYFQGKQGLRQGDPISPLLFVLCMEYFTMVLNKAATQGFIFHKHCTEMKLIIYVLLMISLSFLMGMWDQLKSFSLLFSTSKMYLDFIPICIRA